MPHKHLVTTLVFVFGLTVDLGAPATVLEFVDGSAWEDFSTCTGTDSMPIAWFNRRTNTTFFMAASHLHMYAGIAPTLEEVPHACSGRLLTSHDVHGYESGPQSYANFQWLQSVRVFANGTAVGLVHNEFKGEFAPLGEYCSRHCTDMSPVNASGCRDVGLPVVSYANEDIVRVEVFPSDDSRESSADGEPEELPVAFFSTERGLTRFYSVIDDLRAHATADFDTREITETDAQTIPTEGRVVRFEFVMRDDHGGVDRETRALCLMP